MKKQLLFSVIIPTYQRNDLLAKCLDCLAPEVQTLPAEQYEVIVTDDGLKTTSEEMIRERYPWVKWVKGFCKGPAANRNNGAKFAQGEWLAFTDDDCLPDSHWLKAYAEAIVANSSCLVFEGKTYVNRPKRSLAETSPINETGGYLWSCNFMIRKELFESINGFDERLLTAMEDVDLHKRLVKNKSNIIFRSQASVCHPWRMKKLNKDGWKQWRGIQDSLITYLSIHPEEKTRLNYRYFLIGTIKKLIRETIPGSIKYKFRGLPVRIREHIFDLYMSYYLL